MEIADPLEGDQTIGFLYVYLSDGSLNGDAGAPLVQYELNLLKRDGQGSYNYFDVYKNDCDLPEEETGYTCDEDILSMNPEDSWFISPYYERHFAHNWYELCLDC